jgi:hypothetical protein
MRIQSLDLARGFTVLFIPAIHTVMLYSKPEVYNTWFGYPLQFIAEGPGGQLLMLLMGTVFMFREQRASDVTRKAVILFGMGILLNFLKYGLPYALNILPPGVIRDLQLSPTRVVAMVQILCIGDILQFASIALLILYVVRQCKYLEALATILAIGVLLVSPYVWDTHHSNPVLNYLLELFTGQPPQVFFPVFPWLYYPLAGLIIGHWIKTINSKKIQKKILFIALLCLAEGIAGKFLEKGRPLTSFYRTYPEDTLLHLAIVLLALCTWEYLSRKCPSNPFFHLLTYSSRHITQIYIIQWLVICWFLPLIGYQTLGLWTSVVMSIGVSLTTFGASRFLHHSNFLKESTHR